jgi:hypothetical protein
VWPLAGHSLATRWPLATPRAAATVGSQTALVLTSGASEARARWSLHQRAACDEASPKEKGGAWVLHIL